MEPLKDDEWYRCTQCGGKTRFTVTVTRKVQYFHHQKIGGGMTPEDVEVIREVVDSVVCMYCRHGDAIEVMEGLDTG